MAPSITRRPRRHGQVAAAVLAALVVASCSSSDDDAESQSSTAEAPDAELVESDGATDTTAPPADASSGSTSTGDGTSMFQVEVWADNWMAVYIDGAWIGEDSVPITTERSFNSETFTFESTYPFTIGIEAKDFKETDSGIEYIGQGKQQMGDGGLIAQVTNMTTGEIVASTSADWSVLVIHRAPLNTECEKDADPDTTCQFESIEAPDRWASPSFDASGWSQATEWTAADVGPKDGYDEISWDPSAQLIWGTDLKVDNTILTRFTVDG